MTIYMNKKLMI